MNRKTLTVTLIITFLLGLLLIAVLSQNRTNENLIEVEAQIQQIKNYDNFQEIVTVEQLETVPPDSPLLYSEKNTAEYQSFENKELKLINDFTFKFTEESRVVNEFIQLKDEKYFKNAVNESPIPIEGIEVGTWINFNEVNIEGFDENEFNTVVGQVQSKSLKSVLQNDFEILEFSSNSEVSNFQVSTSQLNLEAFQSVETDEFSNFEMLKNSENNFEIILTTKNAQITFQINEIDNISVNPPF